MDVWKIKQKSPFLVHHIPSPGSGGGIAVRRNLGGAGPGPGRGVAFRTDCACAISRSDFQFRIGRRGWGGDGGVARIPVRSGGQLDAEDEQHARKLRLRQRGGRTATATAVLRSRLVRGDAGSPAWVPRRRGRLSSAARGRREHVQHRGWRNPQGSPAGPTHREGEEAKEIGECCDSLHKARSAHCFTRINSGRYGRLSATFYRIK